MSRVPGSGGTSLTQRKRGTGGYLDCTTGFRENLRDATHPERIQEGRSEEMTGAYNKLIVCGDVIYWYQYDKPPTATGRRVKPAEDGYNALDFNDTELKPKEDRKHERRAQTLRDGSNLVRQMALLNFPPAESTFLTLTYRDHVTDNGYSEKENE